MSLIVVGLRQKAEADFQAGAYILEDLQKILTNIQISTMGTSTV